MIINIPDDNLFELLITLAKVANGKKLSRDDRFQCKRAVHDLKGTLDSVHQLRAIAAQLVPKAVLMPTLDGPYIPQKRVRSGFIWALCIAFGCLAILIIGAIL